MFYRHYIDDIVTLFSSPNHADEFKEYMSSKHRIINFSIEKEEDDCLSFLELIFFVKKKNLQLMSIEKRPSVDFIPTSNVLYLKNIKLV